MNKSKRVHKHKFKPLINKYAMGCECGMVGPPHMEVIGAGFGRNIKRKVKE